MCGFADEGTSTRRRTEDLIVRIAYIVRVREAIHSNHYFVVRAVGRAARLRRPNWAATMRRIDSRDMRLEGA